MIDYDKLLELDYTAHDHYTDFTEKLQERDFRHPVIQVSGRYEDGVPRVDVEAEDVFSDKVYIDSYVLEDVTHEEFEEVMFDIWRDVLSDIEHFYSPE